MQPRLCNRIPSALAGACLVIAANSAVALPVGDGYLIEGQNFPISFTPVPAAFNNLGDLTSEDLADAGILAVTEQASAGTGPNGGDVLQFRFSFLDFTGLNEAEPFAFRLSDLNFATGVQTLLSALLAVDFGNNNTLPATNVTTFTVANNANPFSVVFVSPVTWADLFSLTGVPAGAAPALVTMDFSVETAPVPEPAILPLLGLGLLAWFGARRRAA